MKIIEQVNVELFRIPAWFKQGVDKKNTTYLYRVVNVNGKNIRVRFCPSTEEEVRTEGMVRYAALIARHKGWRTVFALGAVSEGWRVNGVDFQNTDTYKNKPLKLVRLSDYFIPEDHLRWFGCVPQKELE